MRQYRQRVYFTLDPVRGWVYAWRASGGRQRVCWLPFERRDDGIIVSSGARVCIGAATGAVTILDFSDLNNKPNQTIIHATDAGT
jgi:hypothetical protein